MTSTALWLVLCSAIIHAGWNLASKAQRPSAGFFLVASLASALMLAPLVLWRWTAFTAAMSGASWALLGLAGISMAVYYAGLAGAYRAGDLSVAYPLARSLPVLLVSGAAIVLGRGKLLTPLSLLGFLLVVAGSFLLPLTRLSELRPASYRGATCRLALLAALGTAGYSLCDDAALRLVRTAAGETLSGLHLALIYYALEVSIAATCLGAYCLWRPSERVHLRAVWTDHRGLAMGAGLAICLSYVLILLALAHAREVSYIVGFRQFSIPVGALLAMLCFKETPHRLKLVGLALMLAGLACVSAG